MELTFIPAAAPWKSNTLRLEFPLAFFKFFFFWFFLLDPVKDIRLDIRSSLIHCRLFFSFPSLLAGSQQSIIVSTPLTEKFFGVYFFFKQLFFLFSTRATLLKCWHSSSLSLSLCNGCGGRIERESITKMLWRRAIFSLYLTPFTSVSVV